MSLASTVRTSFGFLATLITRYTPLDLSRNSLDGIFNALRISDSVLTAGQPTESQLALLKAEGIRSVINLAPHQAENALPDERSTVEGLGLEYIHIPVDFKNPREQDFARFCEVMSEVGDTSVLVHCAANMRVSAFMYRYRRDVLGEEPDLLKRDLAKIWEPFGVWKDFIARRDSPS